MFNSGYNLAVVFPGFVSQDGDNSQQIEDNVLNRGNKIKRGCEASLDGIEIEQASNLFPSEAEDEAGEGLVSLGRLEDEPESVADLLQDKKGVAEPAVDFHNVELQASPPHLL